MGFFAALHARTAIARSVVLAGVALAALAAVAPARAVVSNEQYGFMNQIGGPGASPGQFGGGTNPGPYGVAVGPTGNVFVVDPNASLHEVDEFAPDGTLITSFGQAGSSLGSINSAYGIAVDSAGTVYVIDTWRSDADRIQYFTSSDGGATYTPAGQIAVTGASGTMFQIAVDGQGFVYVTDSANQRVLKYKVATGTLTATFGDTGVAPAKLSYVKGIVASADGSDVYVVDGNAVKRFHSSDGGATYSYAETLGIPAGTFGNAWGIALDPAGYLFVTDTQNDVVVKATTAGSVVTSWGAPGTDDDSFNGARAVAVSSSGSVYVDDVGVNDGVHDAQNHRVMRYARDLTPPTAGVSGAPAGWTRAAAVNLTFSGSDPVVAGQYTSGFQGVELYLNGVWSSWAGGPYRVGSEGVTTVTYRGVDNRNNVGDEKSVTVRIDRTPPTSRPLAGVSVTQGKTARLRYHVSDALSPKATVTILVRRSGKTVATLHPGVKTVGLDLTYAWTCKLKKGTYAWTVRATDLAGNRQTTTASKKLVVM